MGNRWSAGTGHKAFGEPRKSPLHRLERMGAHPEVLTEKDLPVILESGKWFTRKVEPQASAQLIDALDAIQRG